MATPAVHPEPYEQPVIDQIESVLALGSRAGLTSGVQALRRVMAWHRETLELTKGFQLYAPAPTRSAPRTHERVLRRQPSPGRAIETENAQRPRCRHSDPLRGRCLLEEHKGRHDYTQPVEVSHAPAIPQPRFSAETVGRAS